MGSVATVPEPVPDPRTAPAAAAAALALATVDPARALGSAEDVERCARAAGDHATVSLAARARGVAHLQLRDTARAVSSLRAAVRAGARAGSRQLSGEARMSLAAALGVAGSRVQALLELDAALAELDGLAAARARTQRAAVLQAGGRTDEALADLRRALPVLRRHGDAVWETRALSNRGLLLADRRAFAAAEADLRAALAVAERTGAGLAAAIAEQNLGCVLAGRGDASAALSCFDSAAGRYAALGIEVGSLGVDRGRVLLSLLLVEEAQTAARAAIRIDTAQGRLASLPESRLLLSTAALAAGDARAAVAEADRAARGFRSLGRADGVALARHARLQALVSTGSRGVDPAEARRCATALAAVGWTVPALEARVLAARLALAHGRAADARRDLELAARARGWGPADARARAWLAEGLLRQATGRRRAALRAFATGLRVVETHQHTLAATELRAHVSTHRGALARAGLASVLVAGDARASLRWGERGRATALLNRSPAPPADSGVAQALAELRSTMAQIAEARAAGRPSAVLVRRQVELERAVAARTRAQPGGTGAGPPGAIDLEGLRAALARQDLALVEYLAVDDQLAAVTVAGGRVRLHRLGPLGPVRSRLEQVAFALSRLADPVAVASSGTSAARASLDHASSALDAVLLRPVIGATGDRALVVVPTTPLEALPWSALPSCGGRPVTVSPSATLWLRAGVVRLTRSGPAVVVSGPGLPGAADEARRVAALHQDAVVLAGPAATVERVCTALDGARMAHIAAHGLLRTANPLFSSLLLHDGPLVVYDLDRLADAPLHVVLSACSSARPTIVAGDEMLGLAAALLQQGTTSLVAPVRPVPDTATGALVTDHHRRLVAGTAPAVALADAQLAAVATGDTVAFAVAHSFICLGDGFATVPQAPTGSPDNRR